jgi:hypothetical protein
MNESDPPREQDDARLSALFAESRQQEVWPQDLAVPSHLWRRARTVELLDEEIHRRRERRRPLILGRRAASVAALLAGEALLLDAVSALPDQSLLGTLGLTPTTAALLALVLLPTLALTTYLRREAMAG